MVDKHSILEWYEYWVSDIYIYLHLYGEVTRGKIVHEWTSCVKPHNTVLLGPLQGPFYQVHQPGGNQQVWLRKLRWLPASCALVEIHVLISEHGRRCYQCSRGVWSRRVQSLRPVPGVGIRLTAQTSTEKSHCLWKCVLSTKWALVLDLLQEPSSTHGTHQTRVKSELKSQEQQQ